MSDRFPVFPPLDSFVATLAKTILALPAGALDALAGTFGAPGAANKYVTDTDPRFSSYVLLSKLAGQTITGTITVTNTGVPAYTIVDTPAGQPGGYQWLENGVTKWVAFSSPADAGLHFFDPTGTHFSFVQPAAGDFYYEIDGVVGHATGFYFKKGGAYKWVQDVAPGDEALRFWDGTDFRVYFLNGGNVGIGTAAAAAKLAINGGLHVGGDSDPGDNNLQVDGAFGCNAAAAQTAYASGGALNAYGLGVNGLDTAANMAALHAMVVSIRAALVANGIMS